LHGLPPLFWLSRYVTSHHLAVAPQSGAKDQFYCTIYNITLNSNCEGQGVSKNLKKTIQKIELEAKINAWLI
jgi:hypothetical protein